MERTDKRRRMTEEGRERVRSNAREEGVGQRSGCPGTWNARVCGILISGIPETTDHPTLLPLSLLLLLPAPMLLPRLLHRCMRLPPERPVFAIANYDNIYHSFVPRYTYIFILAIFYRYHRLLLCAIRCNHLEIT